MNRAKHIRAKWFLTVLLTGWCAVASAQQVTDTFTRPNSSALGMTETPIPGITYVERTTPGVAAETAAISGNELRIYGDQTNTPTASSPGQVIIPVDAGQLAMSARMRFALTGAGTTTSTMGGLMLRKPSLSAAIQAESGAYQIMVEMLPTGGFLLRQKNPTGTGLTTLYGNNPWAPGSTLNAFQAAGTLPTSINGSPFDANGDGRLDGTEPFTLGVELSGTSLTVYVNGQAIVTPAMFTNQIQIAPNAPHNYLSLFKNRYSGSPPVGADIYFDDLQLRIDDINDTCAAARSITDGQITGNTTIGNASGAASCGNSNGAPDLWYTYVATCTGDLSVDTCGSGFNTVVAVFDGCGGAELACNDDCAGTPCAGNSSCLTVPVTAGNTYYIRMAGSNGAAGPFNLNLRCGAPAVPLNDTCANATVIATDEVTLDGTTLGATTDGSGSCGNSNASPDVWYSWAEPYDSNLTINTCGTLYNSVISVYDGCGGTELACNQSCGNPNWCGAPASCLTFPVLGGHQYLVRVSGVGGGSGPFRLYLADDVGARHVGAADPTTEGWARTASAAIVTTAPDTTIEPAWSMSQGVTGTLYYSKAMTVGQFRRAEGWTGTWRAKVLASDDVNQTIFQIVDGSDIWVIHAIDGTGAREKGIYKLLQDGTSYTKLGNVDPTDGFHTYQIVYDPASSSVSYHVDGLVLSRQTRAEATNNATLRVMFGDNIAGTKTTAHLCSFADFVMQRNPLAPPNNECTGALPLGDTAITSVTFGATAGGSASCGNSGASPDVWYTYTATCTGELTLDTCGSPMDTVLSVYTGSCGSLTEVACSNDCGGLPCTGPASCVTLQVTAGQQFLIRVAGANGQASAFNLQARCGIPLNDTCASATSIGEGTVSGTNIRATPDGTASCGNSNAGPSVWYRYVAQATGSLRLDTCGSALDTVLSVHSGCGGAEIACNDDCEGSACGAPGSCLTIPATANTEYWIRVAGKDGAEGSFQLRIQDNVLLRHVGSTNPVAEGWTEQVVGTLTRGPASEGVDYWSMATAAGSYGSYAATPTTGQLSISDFQDPSGWTLTGTLRLLAAADVYETQLVVDDGLTDWSLNLVSRDDPGQQGIYTRPATGTPTTADRISDLDPAAGYHTYQIVYDPAGDGGTGMVTYYVDGAAIGTQMRSTAPPAPPSVPYRVLWGDNTSGGLGAVFGEPPAATESHVTFAQFELGQHVYASPPAANATCATAKAVSNGEYYGLTGQGTPDGTASCGTSNTSPTAWYAYTAAATGNLIADTCGSPLDTVLSVYSACGGQQLACNDNTCGTQSRVVVPVTAGNTYLVRVAANGGAAGPFRLHLAGGVPANDTCASALVVGGGATQGTTLGATVDGTASCGDSNASPDVWYQYTATCNAPLEVNTCGSGFDTVVSLHTACGGSEIACNDDGCGKASRVEVNASQGTTYYIRVSGANYAQGDFTMNVLCKEPPVNDACLNAITITDGTTAGTTLYATADGDALCSGQGSASSPDVWYLYTATRTGRLKLDASDANFAALLSLHQPTCPGSLDSQVACGYPILTFSVQQGATYLVRVAGIGNASGSFNLKVGYDTVVIKHEGQNQPLSEGWTRDVNPGQSFTEGAATDTLPFWYLAQIDTLRLNYQYTGLAPSDFSDPQGWTMTAIAKAVTAPTQWQAHLLLQDGQDTWTIHLIDGTSTIQRGVYVTGQTLATLIKISDLDPTADYHQYQIAYNPNSQVATYIIDGTLVYTQQRDQATDSTLRRLVWGDNSSGGGPSHSQWNLVQFEFGSQAAGCFDPVFDSDNDKDVDMDDFGAFQACYAPGAEAGTECTCFDWDRQNGVDLADFAKFAACASGAGIPASPDCDE